MFHPFLKRLPIAVPSLALLLTAASALSLCASEQQASSKLSGVPRLDESSFGKFTRVAEANPILSGVCDITYDCPLRKRPVEWQASGIAGPSAVVRNGKVYLFYTGREWANVRKIDINTARIGLARSADGVHFTREKAPVLAPGQDDQADAEWEGGCQDPRVVESEDGNYVMIYTQVKQEAGKTDPVTRKPLELPKPVCRLAVATSKDLLHWEKRGSAFAGAEMVSDIPRLGASIVCQKNGDKLVAAKIDGKYWMYWGSESVHLATSDDLIRWTPVLDAEGKPAVVLKPREQKFDDVAVVPGPPALLSGSTIVLLFNAEASKPQPIQVEKGFCQLWQEVLTPITSNWKRPSVLKGTTCIGEATFSANAPAKLVKRSERPVFQPEMPYESFWQNGVGITQGQGLIWFKNRWHLYYTASKYHAAVAIADPSGKPVNPPVVRKAKLKSAPVALKMDGEDSVLMRSGWELLESPAVSGSAEEICSPSFNTQEWYDAVVPGTIMGTLVEQGIEPEPLFGTNSLRISEKYCRQSYWYRNAFTLPATAKGKRLELGFDGINYAAEIWLNGQQLGKMKGAFIRGRFDITSALRWDGPNVLAVKILPPPRPGIPHEQTIAEGEGPNCGIATADGPTFGASTMGVDWIPGIRDRAMGIWQDVSIRATGPVALGDPQVVTAVPNLDRAEVTIKVPVNNSSQTKQEGILKGRLGEIAFEQAVTLNPGESQIVAFDPTAFAQLAIDKPRLWWPNGYGQPDLYDLDLSFVEKSGARSDGRRLKIGLREMSYEVSRDASMELIIKVNGQRIFCRGGNWGLDEPLKRLDPVRMDAWVRMHHDANLNMIRNWTGQSNSELFFQMCDQYGILVWQDFWIVNPGDGPDPEDHKLFCENATDTVLRYRNHPSIALWCERNEGVPQAFFLADKIYNAIWKNDTSRLVLANSAAFGVSGHGPYRIGWNQSLFRMVGGMKSERGMPCVPTADSMRAALAPEDQWPISDAWSYHDFCRIGFMGVESYVREFEQSYGKSRDLDDFCAKAQILNYERFRALYESWGHSMWRGSSGLLLWMTHCSWPSTVWQLYAYDLEPTGALFGAQKACEPVHVQMDPRDSTVTVVNMALEPIADGKVEVVSFDQQGKELDRQSLPVKVAANSVADSFKYVQDPAKAARFVSLMLRGSNGVELSRNFYWLPNKEAAIQNFYWPAKTGTNYPALEEMPRVKLEGELVADNSKKAEGKPSVLVRLRNPSEHIAFMTKLTLRDRSGKRVLPVFYGDNYVSLLPNETREIRIGYSTPVEAGKLRVDVEGWNAPKIRVFQGAAQAGGGENDH